MSQIETSELMVKAKNGDKSAFSRIYKETVDGLYFFSLMLFADEQKALGLTQDVYSTVYEELNQHSEDVNVESLLHNIAINKYLQSLGSNIFSSLNESEPLIEDEIFCLRSAIERKDIQNSVLNVIRNVFSESERIVTLLYYYFEMTISQIAAALSCSDNAVKSALYSSRRMLRKNISFDESSSGSVCAMPTLLSRLKENTIMSAEQKRSILASIIGVEAAKIVSKSLTSDAKRGLKGFVVRKLLVGFIVIAIVGVSAIVKTLKNDNPKDVYDTRITQDDNLESFKENFPHITIPPVDREKFSDLLKPHSIPTPKYGLETDTTPNIPQAGTTPVEYSFIMGRLSIKVPENYGVYRVSNAGQFPLNTDSKNLSGREIVFKPDSFSGDYISVKNSSTTSEDKIPQSKEELVDNHSKLYQNVKVELFSDIKLVVDNSNNTDKPDRIDAKKAVLTVELNGKKGKVTEIYFLRDDSNTMFKITFVDFSGIRAEEYEAAEKSIVLKLAPKIKIPRNNVTFDR